MTPDDPPEENRPDDDNDFIKYSTVCVSSVLFRMTHRLQQTLFLLCIHVVSSFSISFFSIDCFVRQGFLMHRHTNKKKYLKKDIPFVALVLPLVVALAAVVPAVLWGPRP